MTIGTILVPAFDAKIVKGAVSAAAPLMTGRTALVGLHMREPYPSGSVAEYYWHTAVMEEFKKGVAERTDEARAAFDDGVAAAGLGTRSEWRQPEGAEVLDLGVQARSADLVVIGDPTASDRPDVLDLTESILIGSARPILLVPEGGSAPLSHVLVAWNGSAEASRAIAETVGILRADVSVTVVTVGEARDGAPGPDEVAETLKRRGLQAEGRTAAKGADGTLATLFATAKEVGADTLVIGAYSRSRLRERILGGVTRRLLKDLPMPTLMVH